MYLFNLSEDGRQSIEEDWGGASLRRPLVRSKGLECRTEKFDPFCQDFLTHKESCLQFLDPLNPLHILLDSGPSKNIPLIMSSPPGKPSIVSHGLIN